MAFSGLVALLIGIGFGRFGFTPLVPGLVQAGWFSAGAAGVLGASNLLGFMAGAQWSRLLLRYFSIPTLLRISMVAALASFAAGALDWGFAWHLSARLVSGVAGGFAMALSVPAVLGATPPAKRGVVAGILFAAMGIGVVISGTVVPWLLSYSLPLAWLGFVAIGAPLAAFAWNGLPRGLPAPPTNAPAQTLGTMGAPVFLIATGICLGAAAFAPHTVYWSDYISRELGLGNHVAGLYWILLGLSACIVPTLLGMTADRIGFTLSLRLTLTGLALAVAVPAIASGGFVLGFSSMVVGGFGVSIASLGSGRTNRMVGPARHAAVWGKMVIGFGIAQAVSAYLMAFLLARTGSYALLFAVGGGLALLGVAADWAAALLERRRGLVGTNA